MVLIRDHHYTSLQDYADAFQRYDSFVENSPSFSSAHIHTHTHIRLYKTHKTLCEDNTTYGYKTTPNPINGSMKYSKDHLIRMPSVIPIINKLVSKTPLIISPSCLIKNEDINQSQEKCKKGELGTEIVIDTTTSHNSHNTHHITKHSPYHKSEYSLLNFSKLQGRESTIQHGIDSPNGLQKDSRRSFLTTGRNSKSTMASPVHAYRRLLMLKQMGSPEELLLNRTIKDLSPRSAFRQVLLTRTGTLKNAFNFIDSVGGSNVTSKSLKSRGLDSDGLISLSEFEEAIRQLRIDIKNLSDDPTLTTRKLFGYFDEDKSGELDIEELVGYIEEEDSISSSCSNRKIRTTSNREIHQNLIEKKWISYLNKVRAMPKKFSRKAAWDRDNLHRDKDDAGSRGHSNFVLCQQRLAGWENRKREIKKLPVDERNKLHSSLMKQSVSQLGDTFGIDSDETKYTQKMRSTDKNAETARRIYELVAAVKNERRELSLESSRMKKATNVKVVRREDAELQQQVNFLSQNSRSLFGKKKSDEGVKVFSSPET